MTTVAADLVAGVMCADSCLTDGTECAAVRKIYRVRGELLGFAGTYSNWLEWLREWQAGELASALMFEDVYVLRMSRQGLSTWDSTNGWAPLEERRWAIGSGGLAARGALGAGATCRQAVAIACTIDAASRGPVRQLTLERPHARRRRHR